ncbi:hypothetical protein [Roseovarius aestuarii]|uniref:EF hand n=1 Tax=Roseovarius aestuarii TaxID=475083 RepID=A0A1X7BVA9_9RHOB|nr:hypothetical protein [Roseovarius aestuarii]SMC13601.1 EF hand [Roseovarius aestuarii]
MPHVPKIPKRRLLFTILLIWPAALQAQQPNDLANDYYVGRAVNEAGALGDQASVELASQRVVAYFFRVQANQDGVVSADDTLDYTRSFVANGNHSRTTDFAKYDLNQDGVATQNELEVSLSQKTWVTASTAYAETRSRLSVEKRFQQLLAERTKSLRDRVSAAPDVDIEAQGDSYAPVEDLQKLLNNTSTWGPPFFSVFDTNSNLQVDFEEFTMPIFAAILAADTDGDGIFSAGEQDLIKEAQKIAEAALRNSKDKFSFPDPR